MKSLLRSGPITALLGWLLWAYMATCSRTLRWRVDGSEGMQETWARDQGLIVAAWHSRIILLPSGWTRFLKRLKGRRQTVYMMISESADGEPIAQACSRVGLDTIRGSSTDKRKKKDKGGVRALAKAIRKLRSGEAVCITPDGPSGPRQRVQAGAILMAQRAGVPIVPFAASSAPARRLSTWDRFVMPLPFGRGVLAFGEPIHVPANADLEAVRLEVEVALNALVLQADQSVGLRHTEPAEMHKSRTGHSTRAAEVVAK